MRREIRSGFRPSWWLRCVSSCGVCQHENTAGSACSRATTKLHVLQAYPLVHAVQEGSKFALQLGYLVERTAFYSPALWLLRQRIVRVSGGELVSSVREHIAWQHILLAP